jgi:hypothetical protein
MALRWRCWRHPRNEWRVVASLRARVGRTQEEIVALSVQ